VTCSATLAATPAQFETIHIPMLVQHSNKVADFVKDLEAPPGFEPGMEVLQIS
jgi:hypothetical protein